MRLLLLIFVSSLGALACARTGVAETFKDGETVCFLGDSISASGITQTIVSNYYATRFPDRTVRFVNAGRSGDTAGGSLQRLQDDVIAKHPTTVAIMFGMNDVNRSSYVAKPGESEQQAQQRALDAYQKNMKTVVERLKKEANDTKFVFITPSPFDETVVLDRDNNQPGCNDGLARCASIVRELASQHGGSVVDYHGPMTELNLNQQKLDPSWTIIGPDRVHPGQPGHLMMAWLFLKSQDVPALVSNVEIDASGMRVAKNDNAEVSSLAMNGDVLTFSILENSLPFPISKSAAGVLDLLPIVADLNQELLKITGLDGEQYELRIDGNVIGRYSSSELSDGINLAMNDATPQFKQAQAVATQNEYRRSKEAQACSMVNTRRWLKSRAKVDPDDTDAIQAYYDNLEVKNDYYATMTRILLEKWSQYDELLEEAKRHEDDVLTGRKPVSHSYELVQVSKP
ncbi:GDSL-like Lipase/Acylhydrolase [Rubripirellula amarantea]|uniref:GDSL-like Lipase/Acylhydrolase n=1 Tax=Rubripirellula amarantea TaxID=2527999 RepID=A0A5C5WK50_9BACT|nr:SGNH/GDSL hydrolase family protein [Rubripirellula amarantea]TWT51158.1 GDSL-like Lipase/Acylhydrolase [Rubripirellula amarantea]